MIFAPQSILFGTGCSPPAFQGPVKLVYKSTHKLTLPLSMKGIHAVLHVRVLQNHIPDLIVERQQPVPKQFEVNGKEEWEVEYILHFSRRRKKFEYLVSWDASRAKQDTREQGKASRIVLN